MRARAALLGAFVLSASAAACARHDELPVTFVAGPRVLAIKAEPPEVPAGGDTTLTAFVVGPGSEAPDVTWTRCRLAPLPGQTINPDCFADGPAPYLEPAGAGVSAAVTMPADVTPLALGLPDATGGFYLTFVARVRAGGASLVAAYRLRLALPGSTDAQRNHNPVFTAVFLTGDAGWSLVDPASPPVVHAGDRLDLSVSADPTSVESYPSPVGDQPGGLAFEVLRASWFADAGNLSDAGTSNAQPSTTLTLDDRLPAAGSPINVYVVIRDERGGTDWATRALDFH